MSSPAPHAHTLSCSKQNCRLPVGRIVNGSLVIVAKHHGEKHQATIPLSEIFKLVSANVDTNLLTQRQKSAILPAESGK